MTPYFESLIAQALTDAGGPPELAPQLIAVAEQHQLSQLLLRWIEFHIGEEWSAMQFDTWCLKYRTTIKELIQQENATRDHR